MSGAFPLPEGKISTPITPKTTIIIAVNMYAINKVAPNKLKNSFLLVGIISVPLVNKKKTPAQTTQNIVSNVSIF